MAEQNFFDQFGQPLDMIFSGFRGLFSAILGRNGKFNFSRQVTQQAQLQQRQYFIDTSVNNSMWVAQNVPHLNVVISKVAELLSLMEIKHVDKDGSDIENSDVLKLLQNPNPLQSLEQFIYEYAVYNCIYNTNFIYKNYGGLTNRQLFPLPATLFCLPPGAMLINATGKLYRQTKIEDIIESFQLYNDQTPFAPSDVIFITEGLSGNGITVGSRLEALQLPLANIMAVLKSFNIITTELGMKGILSPDNTGSNENTKPFDIKESERIDRHYKNKNSLDSTDGHVHVATQSMKWLPMVFDVDQLKLFQGLWDSFGIICAAYGIDISIFPTSSVISKGITTGGEINFGLKNTIQNTIQPIGDKLMGVFMKHFGFENRNGEKLIASWTHMPIMKEDELKKEQARKALIDGLSVMKKDGIIDAKSYAEMADVELTGTGETEHPPTSQSFGQTQNQ